MQAARTMEAIGPGGTGKSTFMNLAQRLLGERNTYVTTLNQLEENRFEGAAIYRKRLLVITDSERYGGEVTQLKAITGQDPIRYEKKHKQQGEELSRFTPTCMVIVAANEIPQTADYTYLPFCYYFSAASVVMDHDAQDPRH